MFEPKRDEVTGGCRKVHSQELHTIYSSPCIIRMVRSRNEMGGAYSAHGRVLFESVTETFHSEDLRVNVMILLKWILGKEGVRIWSGLIWLRIDTWRALMDTANNPRV
jgi:hypothetical protein